jgi:RNA polymerase sigma-70 factor (ECF subfamily)
MGVNDHLSDKAKYDFELVQRAVKGDQKAYAELMERYRDAIFFMLLKMVNNRDDADDLTIEAFGKAFKRIEQYQPNYAFSTWLFKIASNNCIDFLRKERKKKMFSLDNTISNDDGDDLTYDVKDGEPDPEESLMKGQKVEAMREVVEKLKPRYRELVMLRYFKEYSYEEIAEELDLPLGTVKAQLFRARDLLANLLKHTKERI